MKALTVQQPWAWAILHGGKDVENRTQTWSHRGLLAIHAGARVSDRGLRDVPAITNRQLERSDLVTGAVIGTVHLTDVHTAYPGCCDSPWAETHYDEHGGRTRRDVVHLVLDKPSTLR